jgi:hypothetical protein
MTPRVPRAVLAPVTFECSIRLHFDTEPGAAFVFALLPARTHQQQLAMEQLRVRGDLAHSVFIEAATATRYLHVAAAGGSLQVDLDAQLRLLQTGFAAGGVRRAPYAAPLARPESLRFLLPSRYCPSDRLAELCDREFMGVEEPALRLTAIDDWLRRHLRTTLPDIDVELPLGAGAAPAPPGAAEVLERRRGTPRDLAHLLIALCRASRLPARYVTSIPFDMPTSAELYPWVEVLIDDAWLACDPGRQVPRTALIRIGTGRDAADVPLVLGHGPAAAGRAELSMRCVGTDVATLRARDRATPAIVSATIGSLGAATRWHQEARLAARRESGADEPPARRAPPARRRAAAGSGARGS